MAVGLARFLDKDADLYFAGLRDETENDRLKYLLSELIRNAQALLDKIQEYEDELDYPIIRKY